MRALLLALLAPWTVHAAVLEPAIPKSALRPGSAFTSADMRVLQADDFANPGMLWVGRGERLWREAPGSAGSCQSCHGDARESMKGVATRYPRVDAASARLVNVSGRVNLCRERHQKLSSLPHESDDLLALTAYVNRQSYGLPMNVTIDINNDKHVERGRSRFLRRMGQMNLACAHCHDRNWGRTLLNETISQGHGTGFPAYRTEWQTLGSLERRIRACYSGLRAQMPPYGARELVELELFLAWRANGVPIETPAVRR